ncbi:3-oxoacyl-[ACP] synthase [Rubellimicrobium mesophilum DSM 19309]|uniref:3-oxoacyl-[ACP] synthase n=1 Tax=Rubellimicrobium mesophilum DSM 19309 TaxID=442562 RepID=A0A017HUK2_9RHOB|nr:3-oxoacyl-ACP synthase [Rubellimicrobium mesophilum]EYD77439.1 3-oxoacyl-[ACP] synthase [Rubellimicrobium mesophilum DSM 19309]
MASVAAPTNGVVPGLSVVGYGMWTALGPDGPATVAGLDARLVASEVGGLWDPTSGTNLPAFRVAAHQWWTGPTFLPELILPVLEECFAQVATFEPSSLRRPAADVPVLLNLAPKDRPSRPETLGADVLRALAGKLGRALPEGSAAFDAGRVGLPFLLSRAAQQAQRHPVQILIGVESFVSQSIVDHYIGRNRLLCGANSSGFIVGEAAAAIIVVPAGASAGPELLIAGMGAGRETSRDGGSREAPVTAEGLTQAMRAALAAARTQYFDIPNLFGDLNGEHFKFKEAAIATMRLDRVPPENASRRPRGHVEHWNAIEGLGEVGAALMPAQLGWAFEAGRSGRLPQGRAVMFAGEDDGMRVAMVTGMTRAAS